jgi:hypothetical protein
LRHRLLHGAARNRPRAEPLVRAHRQHAGPGAPALRRISRDSTRCPSRSPENPRPGPSTTHRPETPNTAPGVSTCPNQQNTRPNPTKINPTAINALLKDRGVTGGVGHPGSGA